MKRTYFLSLLYIIAASVMLQSCIEDGFSSSASDQPEFSVDTLQMGQIFTENPSTTHRFVVYNRADKGIAISKISLSGANAPLFRLNVDGFSGREFDNVEIRANDSIFVFVEATLPANGRNVPVEVTAGLDFLTNGVTRTVTLSAQGRDVERLRAVTVTHAMTLTADKPWQVFDSLVVAPGAVLDIRPGAELLFHDGASLIVRGTLRSVGEPGHEITMAGDRTGNVVTDISFDVMSRQWQGVFFTSTSHDNVLTHTCVRNTWQGVTINGTDVPAADRPDLTMVNSRLRNAAYCTLEALHADVRAYGCEFAEAGQSAVHIQGGSATLQQCTLSNYYLFAAISGPLLSMAHFNEASADETGLPFAHIEVANSILYGLGDDLPRVKLDGTDITLRRCMLKSEGSDDANFIDCLWKSDPLFYTEREEYLFDYRLKEGSPAIGAGYASLNAPECATDAYGNARGNEPDLGAYVYMPAAEPSK